MFLLNNNTVRHNINTVATLNIDNIPDGYVVKSSYLDVFKAYYEELDNLEEENNIDIELNFEEYCNHFYKVDTSIYEYNNYLIYISLNEVKFNEEEELLIDEYNNIYNSDNNDDIDNIMSSSSSGSSDKDKEYYFLTGTECPSEYVNSQYNFNSIWVGDII